MSDVSVWYSKHSHVNHLGIVPPDEVRVCAQDKFEIDSGFRPDLQRASAPMFIIYEMFGEKSMPRGNDELELNPGEKGYVPYEVPHLAFASSSWAFGCFLKLLNWDRDEA